ncbi:hypothetical protein JW926_04570 [Candidatus Sumerlaeota bacterium]|nr:hypothetical protein [Candidatus Sumerlaeota bacterium]
MINLREILKECEPSLWTSLEGAWKIAQNEWFSALKMESESHGGEPHVKSVEEWLNRIAEACKPIWRPQGEIPFSFNPVEIYITLCSVLFHDIGRGRPCEDHGKVSREIIERHWAQLGIHDKRIAHEIGLICQFHTSSETWPHHSITTIHPWGVVHIEAIASLLTLADELDTAYTRSLPEYIKDPRLLLKNEGLIGLNDLMDMEEDFFTKGLFREFIGDVNLDPDSNLIKTVLFNNCLPGQYPPIDSRDTDKSASSSWLKNFRNQKSITEDNFSTEDHFFSYLQEMRSQINVNIHNLLAHQFQKADNFDRVKLIHDLNIPEDYPLTRNLIYNLHLWNRQITTGPNRMAHREKEEQKDFCATVNLIKDTISEVERKIRGNSGKHDENLKENIKYVGKKKNGWDLLKLLKLLFRYLVYLHFRKEILKTEQRDGKDKVEDSSSALYDHWKNYINFNKPNIKLNNEQSFNYYITALETKLERKTEINEEISALKDLIRLLGENHSSYIRNPHQILLLIFRYLLHFDLFQLAEDLNINKRNRKPTELALRTRDSWTIKDFHRNVLFAFHVYLANVRYLWKSNDEIDFRYEARGKLESAFSIEDDVKGYRELLKRLSPIFRQNMGNKTNAKSNNKKDIEKELLERINPGKELLDDLHKFSERSFEIGSGQFLLAKDFEFAVRFMFMQWLSGDILKKRKKLYTILPGLEKLEIPFREWYIEYNNHLFDGYWKLRIEPSLTVKRMIELFEAVLHLEEGLHTEYLLISWDTLAAELRDPKMVRVKAAAKRMANLIQIFKSLNDLFPQSKSSSPDSDTMKGHFHFGHLLLSEMNYNRSNKILNLETSHSGWRLNKNSDSNVNLDYIKDYLKRMDNNHE